MKHIIIPGPVKLGDGGWPFRKTLEWILDNDPAFLRPATNARAAQRILVALDCAETTKDPVLSIKPDDFKLLSDAAERWQSGITFTTRDGAGRVQTKEVPLRLLLAHIDAIAEARVNDPRPELEAKADVKTEEIAEAPAN